MTRLVALVVALVASFSALGLAPLEQWLLFRPRSVDAEWLKAVSTPANGIEEVRLLTPDGVTLHGWLKRPARWKPGGKASRMVSWITRWPAKPTIAPGSAIWMSPSMAKEAVTPPVVGSVRTTM